MRLQKEEKKKENMKCLKECVYETLQRAQYIFYKLQISMT